MVDRVLIALISASAGAAFTWWLRGNDVHDGEIAARIDDAVRELSCIEDISTALWRQYKTNETEFFSDHIEEFFLLEAHLHRFLLMSEFFSTKIPDYNSDNLFENIRKLRIACTYFDQNSVIHNNDNNLVRIKSILAISTIILLEFRKIRWQILPSESFRNFGRKIKINMLNALRRLKCI